MTNELNDYLDQFYTDVEKLVTHIGSQKQMSNRSARKRNRLRDPSLKKGRSRKCSNHHGPTYAHTTPPGHDEYLRSRDYQFGARIGHRPAQPFIWLRRILLRLWQPAVGEPAPMRKPENRAARRMMAAERRKQSPRRQRY